MKILVSVVRFRPGPPSISSKNKGLQKCKPLFFAQSVLQFLGLLYNYPSNQLVAYFGSIQMRISGTGFLSEEGQLKAQSIRAELSTVLQLSYDAVTQCHNALVSVNSA